MCAYGSALVCLLMALAYSSTRSYGDSGAVVTPSGSSAMSAGGVAVEASGRSSADGVTVAGIPAYDRSEWLPGWSDDDGDGLDTRAEVLDQESLTEVVLSRTGKVLSGRWVCPYTGVVYDSAYALDIEHVVPLKEAHVSGGWAWSTAKKRRYSNYLGMRSHLQAVGKSSNRSKGDRRPDEWLPPYRQYRCSYVRDWVAVKRLWGLSMAPRERAVVDSVLSACGG